jgi:protocatechuate 3,4-dioxygenase beta subunit
MGKSAGVFLVLVALAAGAWLLSSGGGGDAPEPFVGTAAENGSGARVEPAVGAAGTGRANAPEPRIEEGARNTGAPSDAGQTSIVVAVEAADGSGRAVADLPVHAFQAGSGPWGRRVEGRTDPRGEARLDDLEPGSWVVRVALGASQAEVDLADGETVRVRFVLKPGVTVRGEVVGSNGLPIAGASIWLSEPWDDARGAEVATSGADGKFVLQGAHRGQSIGASAAGYAASPVVPVQSEGGVREVRIVLATPMGTVQGRVVDGLGAPVEGARVLLGRPDRPFDRRGADGARLRGPAPRLVETDRDGRFLAERLEPGVTRIEAEAPGHGASLSEVDVVAGGGVEVLVSLPGSASIAGTCRATDGAPLAGVEIRTEGALVLGARRTVSTADGSYRLADVAAGLVAVAAQRSGRDEAARGEVDVRAGQEARWDPVIEVADTGREQSVRGRVVDLRGQPLPGYRIVAEALPRGSAANASATVGGEGAFTVVAQTETVRLLVFGSGGFAGFPVAVMAQVERGRTDVEFRVDAFALSGIRGRVLDRTGSPIQASVQVWHEDARVFREVVVDAATGRFSFEPAPAGTCTVEIRSEDHPWQRFPGQQLQPGRVTDLGDVVLAAGGRIEGSVTFEDGGAPSALSLRFVDESAGREVGVAAFDGGRFRSNPLPLGPLTLVVEGEGVGSARLPLTLDEAQPFRVVDLRVTRGVPVTLRVELPPGIVRPERLALGVLRERDVVWTRALGAGAGLEAQLYLAPGSYRALLRGEGPMADVPFDVGPTGSTVVLRASVR